MDADSIALAVAKAVAAGATTAPVVAAKVEGSVLNIDGDGLNYACAGNDDTSLSWARTRLLQRVKNLVDATGAETVHMHLSVPGGSKRHRHAIATVKPYQGQRKNHKPKNWDHLREILSSDKHGWHPVQWSDREADDGIALASQHLGVQFIASADKDMRMLPGIHVDMGTMAQTVVRPCDYDVIGSNGKQYGLKWFYLQLLHGDSVDNIPGLPRVKSHTGSMVLCGEVRAQKMLADATNASDAFQVVCSAYHGYYGEAWPDMLVEQGALLWLSRQPDANDWVPPIWHSKILTPAIYRLKERVYASA